ncbi:MAG: hypothetical protein FK733_14815 [Asgard group archaeon]|nr:hypothetical protein [Asgard group archaeon]
MKFEEYGMKKENLTIDMKPQEFIEHNLLKDLQNLIGYIRKHKSTILKEFLTKFSEKLKSQTKNHFSIANESKFADLISQYENLVKNQDITKLSLNFFLEKLSITEKQLWENNQIQFPNKKFHNTANGYYFNQITTFVELFGKKEAISLYRDVLKNFILTYDLNQKDAYESLDDMRERHIRFIKKGIFGRVRLFSEVVDGKLIMICKNCEKVEQLDESIKKEPDLLFNLTCWCHIPLAELWNGNFELTIEDSIAKGDPFCTYVYYDKSVADKIEHSTKIQSDKSINEYSES